MQSAEVEVTQLGNVRSEPKCDPRGRKRVGVGSVGLTVFDAIVLTHRAQGPLPSPKAIELFVEYARIDNEHPVWAADSVEQ